MGNSQDPPVQSGLEKAVKEAKDKQAIVEAELAALKASLPQTDTKGLDGKLEIKDGAGYYAEILAYRALSTACGQIKTKIKTANSAKRNIVISVDADISRLSRLARLTNLKIDAVINELQYNIDKFKDPEPDETRLLRSAAAMIAAPKILGAVADIAAFFKSDITIAPKKFTIDQKALNVSLATQLMKDKDNETSIYFLDRVVSDESEVFKKLEEIIEKRDLLINIRNDYRINHAEKTKVVEVLDSVIESTNAFIKEICTSVDNAPTPLEAASIMDFIKVKQALILNAFIASHGGEIETIRHAFKRTRISYLGGVIIGYDLSDENGQIIAIGIEEATCNEVFKRKFGNFWEKLDGMGGECKGIGKGE